MASISKQANGRFRVQIDKAGRRDSKIFDTRHQAMAWAVQREEELTGKQLPVRTLDQALARYAEEVSPGHAGCNWELVRIGAMRRSPLAARRLACDRSASGITTCPIWKACWTAKPKNPACG